MTTAQITPNISIAPNQHFCDALAKKILVEHAQNLPYLSPVNIIIPNAQAALQMRHSLANMSQQTLLGGFIGSLDEWLNDRITPTDSTKKHINQSTRQILLIEALKQHSELFATENHWQICDSLLELFDELSLSQHQWLHEGTPVWVEKLQSAYQLKGDIAHLNLEAKIIQTLWQAWQQQLNALELIDDTGKLKQRLLADIPDTYNDNYFYIIGAEQFTPLEQAWCEQLAAIAPVIYISQLSYIDPRVGTYISADTSTDKDLTLLHDIFSTESTLQSRTQNYKNNNKIKNHDGFLNKIKLFDAQSAEQETQAVELKIRMSLLKGNNNIAVVTENRKLARRLRALLERAEVNIQDTAGWALATTSAATILERWLECIEQDFAYQPLLDLLKSPFFCNRENATEHLNLVYRFEQDIVLHENIANNLSRYKAAIKNRAERLNINNTTTAEQLTKLIDTIESAAEKLQALFQSSQPSNTELWIEHFINSIKQLGIYQQFDGDIAGQRVQEELQQLTHAHLAANPKMSWQDLRTWIGSTLEREQFKPQGQISAVKIMNMQQAQYCQFDTLIIAGANMKSFPGTASVHPFFNQSVRQALQLKNWQQKKQNNFNQFQQLLMAADDILITWQAEKNGEWMQVSPWVSSLQDFSQQAYKLSLHDENLENLLNTLNPITEQNKSLLESIENITQAKPVASNELVPKEFSASRHQRLIDCPYKFFAADILKLKPLERITLELLKSEYGEKVHLILHAFHQQCPNLPTPFTDQLTASNKAQALTHIENLSQVVFKTQTEDSIQHRGWYSRWMDTAESYIDWQIQRQLEWHIYKLEEMSEQDLTAETKLQGRLDRIDQQADGFSIIDYKTGNTARQKDIDLGENIQLTSYAALLQDVCNVIYLKLDKGVTKVSGILEGDELNNLKTDVLQRLESVVSDIQAAQPLPSWGDSKACNYCEMSGLCRKQMWEIVD